MNITEVRESVPRHFPISVKIYHLMAERGAFEPDDRVELIGGEIFYMSPIGNLHARCFKFLTNYLVTLLTGKFVIGVQDPVVLDDFSEPQPDISILRYRADFYKDETPSAKDTVLVIEVADTSASFDRSLKLQRYASAGVGEFWLIDLSDDHVEVYRGPRDDSYAESHYFSTRRKCCVGRRSRRSVSL